ncbi:MAG: tyrosine-type recombinase/integrase [Bacteroidales bacterium]|nr:tyrosine-type recombinase/integrase [Bacteroidales bacterium]
MNIGSNVPNVNMMNTMNADNTDLTPVMTDGPTGTLARRECEENWEILLAAFLDSQDLRQKSRETYYWGMVQYFRWMQESGHAMKSMTPADVMSFKNFMVKKRLSPLTIGSYLTAVRQFYKWTENTMLYPNIARSVKPPRGKKGFRKMHLNETEASDMLAYLKSKSLRDYAMVNLILRTGLRTIEVVRADVEDIRHKRGRRILKVWGKGYDDKDNFVILGDAVWNPIQEYLNTRGLQSKKEPLFVTDGKGHRGARMSTRSVQYVCKESMKAIGLEGHEYSAHSLRHTTAVLILKNGGDWQDVQRVLRHSSPATSQIYTASIEEEVRLDRNPESILDNVI